MQKQVGPEAAQSLPYGFQEVATAWSPVRSSVCPLFIKARPSCQRLQDNCWGPGGTGTADPGHIGLELRFPEPPSPPCPWPFLRLPSRRERRNPGLRPLPSTPMPPRDPCSPHHPAPQPHSARLTDRHHPGPLPTHQLPCLLPAPSPGSLAAALSPQGHVYTNVEGTRSIRKCSCTKNPFPGPTHSGPKSMRGGGASHELHPSCLPSGFHGPSAEGGAPTRQGPCIVGCLVCH